MRRYIHITLLRKLAILINLGICESPYCWEGQAFVDDALTPTNIGASRATPQSVNAPHILYRPSSFSYRILRISDPQSPVYHTSRISLCSFFHHCNPAFPHLDANDKSSHRKVGYDNALGICRKPWRDWVL